MPPTVTNNGNIMRGGMAADCVIISPSGAEGDGHEIVLLDNNGLDLGPMAFREKLLEYDGDAIEQVLAGNQVPIPLTIPFRLTREGMTADGLLPLLHPDPVDGVEQGIDITIGIYYSADKTKGFTIACTDCHLQEAPRITAGGASQGDRVQCQFMCCGTITRTAIDPAPPE